jgi:hypothetical protein
MRRQKTEKEKAVSATQLAEMGHCEMRMLLAHRLGERMTTAQRQARARGDAAHARYLAEGRAAQDRRCFIASHVLGADAVETQVLRRYRDTVLLPHWWGRRLVQLYYRSAPCICRVLEMWPGGSSLLRRVLRRVANACRDAMREGDVR